MIIKALNLASTRREFSFQEPHKAAEKKYKFQEDSGRSHEEVFNFAFKDDYSPLLQNLAQPLKGINVQRQRNSDRD